MLTVVFSVEYNMYYLVWSTDCIIQCGIQTVLFSVDLSVQCGVLTVLLSVE